MPRIIYQKPKQTKRRCVTLNFTPSDDSLRENLEKSAEAENVPVSVAAKRLLATFFDETK
jgi:hypothetical protein